MLRDGVFKYPKLQGNVRVRPLELPIFSLGTGSLRHGAILGECIYIIFNCPSIGMKTFMSNLSNEQLITNNRRSRLSEKNITVDVPHPFPHCKM